MDDFGSDMIGKLFSLFSLMIALWQASRLRHIRDRLAKIYSKFRRVCDLIGLQEIDLFRSEKMFKNFGKNVDSFITELKDTSGNGNEEFRKRLDELKKSKDTLGEKFKDFKDENQDKWDDVQTELDRAGQEFKKAVNNLFSARKS